MDQNEVILQASIFAFASINDLFSDFLELQQVADEPDKSRSTIYGRLSSLEDKKLIYSEGTPSKYQLSLSGESLFVGLVSVANSFNSNLRILRQAEPELIEKWY